MPVVNLKSQSGGIVVRSLGALQLAVICSEKARAHGRCNVLVVDARIEVSKIEEVIAQLSDGNVTAKFGITFVVGIAEVAAKQVHSAKLGIIRIERRGLHPQGMEVEIGRASCRERVWI